MVHLKMAPLLLRRIVFGYTIEFFGFNMLSLGSFFEQKNIHRTGPFLKRNNKNHVNYQPRPLTFAFNIFGDFCRVFFEGSVRFFGGISHGTISRTCKVPVEQKTES